MEILQCVRCGICCVECLCCVGEEGDDGICKFLSFDTEKAICQLIKEGKMPEGAVGKSGCTLRTVYKDDMDLFNLVFNNTLDYIKRRKE